VGYNFVADIMGISSFA